jgi:dihydrofolate reductase
MRKVILDLAISLDGFIEGPNGEIDWCIMEEEMDILGFLSKIDSIFYGRKSYDLWGEFDPMETQNPSEKELWESIHQKNKFVFSRSKEESGKYTLISENIKETVQSIKSKDGKDIWLYGGASLIKTFIEENLIDVYQLSVHPIALGSGLPLFENLKERLNLKLLEVKRYKSGVVQLIYIK